MAILKKISVMALLGAFGAVIGAILGEVLFVGVAPQPRNEPRRVCLLFDISGSMNDRVSREPGAASVTQLEALKDAACDFVGRRDLATDPMALAVFASDAHIVTGLSSDEEAIQRAIRGLYANGGTNLGRGFDAAGRTLADASGERWVLVFTDGKPESSSTGETPEAAALTAARRLREQGINIVAIGTRLADAGLLAGAAGTPENVIISDPVKLDDAFRRSEEVITRQMLASRGIGGDFLRNMLLTSAWAALIAVGAAAGLVVGQNRHVRRRPLSVREGASIAWGGIATGLVAGAAGQSLFFILSTSPSIVAVGRVVAWTLLGAGTGYGMGSFVPNLDRRRAAAAGATGGVAAAFCFLTLVPLVGDTIGRLLGALMLGLSTGLMMVIVEAVYREASLIVHWSPKEQSTFTLGANPILVGASPEAHVLIAEDDSPKPVMARISMGDGFVRLEDLHKGETRALRDGESVDYGRVRLEVRASGRSAEAPAAPAPRAEAPPARAGGKWYAGEAGPR